MGNCFQGGFPMKVEVPMMVDDGRFAPLGRPEATENVWIEKEGDFFLDGPVTRQVAVLDFDEVTGARLPGAVFIPPTGSRTMGRYDVPKTPDVTSRAFNQVSVFATVVKTIQMYEEADTLGREVRWSFDGPQLLVVPRAGEWANAFYQRASRSLQFFYFTSPQNPAEIIYTSLSRDIVAHETGHAILDGIAPHLYDAVTPESLALHEAIGDLTALLVSMRSSTLVKAVLEKTGGSIEDASVFSAIATEFGMARGTGALRDLRNDKTIHDVDRSEPHALSEVLTGALYPMLVKMHDDRKKQRAQKLGITEYSASGWALATAANQLKRMVLRALDYLPPGEISFADYGRAIIAADQASHPDDAKEREWIVEEFVHRGLAPDRAALEVPFSTGEVLEADLDTLLRSDYSAYRFAEEHRDLLHIPLGTPFEVAPRLEVKKKYYHRQADGELREEQVSEMLFKVSWLGQETIPLGNGGGGLEVVVGTTLAVNRDTREIRFVLTSARDGRPEEAAEQQEARAGLLHRLVQEGLLRSGGALERPDGKPRRAAVAAEMRDGRLRVSGAAHLLHMTEA
jgi:hypothetical protein